MQANACLFSLYCCCRGSSVKGFYLLWAWQILTADSCGGIFLWICWRFSGWVSLILTFFMYTMLCLVTHSCLTLWNPRDCSLPGSSVHEDSPGKNTWVCFHALLQGIFPIQESNPGIFHFRWILYHLSHQGSPFMYIEHLKLAIQLLSPLLLPRVYPKADQGSWGYFRLQFMPQFSCLVSCHQSTVTSCCDERLQICYVCAYGWGGQNCNDYFQRNHLYFLTFFCCCSVTQLCPTLWLHGLQYARLSSPSPTYSLAQTHVHWVNDAIQLSHPLSLPSPPALSLPQHQGLFQWACSLHQMANVLDLIYYC